MQEEEASSGRKEAGVGSKQEEEESVQKEAEEDVDLSELKLVNENLEESERDLFEVECCMVQPMVATAGVMTVTTRFLYFEPKEIATFEPVISFINLIHLIASSSLPRHSLLRSSSRCACAAADRIVKGASTRSPRAAARPGDDFDRFPRFPPIT